MAAAGGFNTAAKKQCRRQQYVIILVTGNFSERHGTRQVEQSDGQGCLPEPLATARVGARPLSHAGSSVRSLTGNAAEGVLARGGPRGPDRGRPDRRQSIPLTHINIMIRWHRPAYIEWSFRGVDARRQPRVSGSTHSGCPSRQTAPSGTRHVCPFVQDGCITRTSAATRSGMA